MKNQWMIITPETAKEWLSNNTNNRSLSSPRVDQYADDMRKGNWNASHQGIAFYEDGTLADGQHRLHACVKSGKTLETFVAFGIPRVAASGIDCHRARRMDDQIKIAGMADWIGQTELGIARLVKSCRGGGGSMSSHEAVDLCNAHKEAIQATTKAVSTRVRYLTTAPVMVAMACAHHIVGDGVLHRFGAVLTKGVMEDSGDLAAIRLRERLMMDGPRFTSSGQARVEGVKITMRAIKAFAARENLRKLTIPEKFIYPLLGSKA